LLSRSIGQVREIQKVYVAEEDGIKKKIEHFFNINFSFTYWDQHGA